MKSVLFLCTGNSARSQMAEALTNHHRRAAWQASSAGIAPSSHGVHPQALAVLREAGIDTSDLHPKSLDAFQAVPPDLVVTVCDNAAAHCPLWVRAGVVAHVPFADPSSVVGPGDAKRKAFRATRDQMLETLVRRLESLLP